MVDDVLAPRPDGRRSQRYPFRVEGKEYYPQFLPMAYLDGYDDADLARLAATDAWEITFMLEDYRTPSGEILGGYGMMKTGSAFQVLGGVASYILDWAEKHQPEYLYWYAQGSRRQHLYDGMVRYFEHKSSGWRRLPNDPFTGSRCSPEVFWIQSVKPPYDDR